MLARRGLSRLRGLRDRLAPVLPALRGVGFVAAVAIVAYMGYRAAVEVEPSEITWWPLAPALGFAAIWWTLLGRGWGLVAAGHATRGDVSVWCRTQAVRYLPGGFWAPAARVAVLRGGMVDRLSTVIAENLTALCAALAIGAGGLAVSGRLWALPGVLIALAPVFASRFMAGRTRVEPVRIRKATGNYLLAFMAYAASAVLVQAAVSGVHDVPAVVGAAAVAWGAGLVVVIAPGGVGVREVVYVFLLSDAFPDGELAAAAVTSRLVVIAAELLVLVIAGRPPASGATADAGAGAARP